MTTAAAAADAWASTDPQTRAALLCGLADALEAERQTLVPLADAETSVGAARLNGELDRTGSQLRGFADQVLSGAPFAMTDAAAVATRDTGPFVAAGAAVINPWRA